MVTQTSCDDEDGVVLTLTPGEREGKGAWSPVMPPQAATLAPSAMSFAKAEELPIRRSRCGSGFTFTYNDGRKLEADATLPACLEPHAPFDDTRTMWPGPASALLQYIK